MWDRYDSGMDTEKKELWDRLDTEPERAYRAFESFLTLPSGERTILEAYRSYVGNPQAVKPSDTWNRWSSQFAWRERAAAYDDHLASVRRHAYERGIEEEAERQGALAERTRNRFNELMTVGYEAAMKSLEELAESGGMSAREAINVIKLHFDATREFSTQGEGNGDGWTEEDDAEFADIVQEIEGEEESQEDSDEGAEAEDSEEGS